MTHAAQKKSSLRHKLRNKRRSLSTAQQKAAAQQLQRRLLKQPCVQQAKHIAFYWPSDGEISPLSLAAALEAQGKKLYLPVVQGKSLQFKRYSKHLALRPNRFGILEPCQKVIFPAKQLDLIFMPLVGFDEYGHRLGMGGGFYDRALAFKQAHYSPKPRLIGLAHACQQVDKLNVENWDISVDAIASNSRFIETKRA